MLDARLERKQLVISLRGASKRASAGACLSGEGLRTTTKRNLPAGSHQIRVALTKKGRSLRSHHKNARVRVSLTVGKQAVASTAAVHL